MAEYILVAAVAINIIYMFYDLYQKARWHMGKLDLHQSYIEDIDERLRKIEGKGPND